MIAFLSFWCARRRPRALPPLLGVRLLGAALLAVSGAGHPLAAQSAMGRVHQLVLTPATGGAAQLTVAIDSGVKATHFLLDGPARLVVDLAPARLVVDRSTYDGVVRGPVKDIRLAQYREDTVRVVVELDAMRGYKVFLGRGRIQLRVDGPEATFIPWNSRRFSALSAPAGRAARHTGL